MFTAAKQLADSEIELIKVIESSSKCQRTVTNMFESVKKTRKPGKSKNVNIIYDLLLKIMYKNLLKKYNKYIFA